MADRPASLSSAIMPLLGLALGVLGRAGDSATPPGGNGGLVPGSLDVAWIHGSASCSQNADPE
ncbi:MAG TPA: hypothetical protein VGC42_29710, partial [Kofleriaceae bacterium]